jgi:5-methyltetrahydrofolate--homocysteine methyltransferase
MSGRKVSGDMLQISDFDLKNEKQEKGSLYQDALALLKEMEYHQVRCSARYGFFEAVSEGDDIIIGKETLPTLRQQSPNEKNVYHSLSDYIIPTSEGRTDYIGAFAVTAGTGFDSLKKQIEKEQDSYRLLLLQSWADRLAEASSEYLHQLVRKELWGYAADEALAISDLFKGKYRGIRPAVGYPSLPDQGLIFTLDKLLQFNKIGIHLTENGAMTPSATVAGFYFANPEARYFMVGRISEEQLREYAVRRDEDLREIRKLLDYGRSI